MAPCGSKIDPASDFQAMGRLPTFLGEERQALDMELRLFGYKYHINTYCIV